MPKVVFIEPDGREYKVEVSDGATARDAAVDNNIPGIDGDCGGTCACATCHVHVDPKWVSAAGKPEEGGMELELLQFAEGNDETSRLACQIVLTPDLDGIVLRIPEAQH